MGYKIIEKPYSAKERCNFVDLTRTMQDLEDEAIYDYFVELGLSSIVTPAHQVRSPTSRDRTVWFSEFKVSKSLLSNGQSFARSYSQGLKVLSTEVVAACQRTEETPVTPISNLRRGDRHLPDPTGDSASGTPTPEQISALSERTLIIKHPEAPDPV
ncbi:hypothetical protein Plhal304r1_c011g0043621 [Plasmopara halstedii]